MYDRIMENILYYIVERTWLRITVIAMLIMVLYVGFGQLMK